eukprot:3359209-Amphidinium_carterae.1
MAPRTFGKNRKIQNSERHDADDSCVLTGPLGSWHTCRPRGRNVSTRTMQLFDMVAELARICVTRASQLFYTIAWLCGFCVGTLRAYIEGAT